MPTRPTSSASHMPTMPALWRGVSGTSCSTRVDGLARAHVGVGGGDGERRPAQRPQEFDAGVRRRVGQSAEDVRRRSLDVERVADARCEQRRGVRQRAVGAGQSNDALRPRSASSGAVIVRRVSPAASVSSVIGVGPKKPVPTESRLVQRPARASADTRGLKNVPYSL